MRESMRRLLNPAQQLMESTDDPVERITHLVDLHVRKHARDNMLCLGAGTEIRSLSPPRRREASQPVPFRSPAHRRRDGPGRGRLCARWRQVVCYRCDEGPHRTGNAKAAAEAFRRRPGGQVSASR